MSRKKRNAKKPAATSEAKKAAVLGMDKKSRAPLFVTLAVAAVAAAAGFYLVNGSKTSPVKAQAVGASQGSAGVFTYNAGDFADGKAKYFSYRSPEGINIRYFIMKSSDGIIRAAYDACDTCWSSGKGYHQEGDYMVCNNCGQRFSSVKINVVKGGCNPAPLSRSVKSGKVLISVQDIIREGSFYFDFGKRS
jgi:uncharacterized membrane protein